MKKQLPGLLPISLLMFTAVLAVWLGLAGPLDLVKIEKWQTLIGATITGAGIVVASWNVTRQMRLTARSKEIDRLERDIPGLRDAHYFMSRIAPSAPRVLLTAETVVIRFRDLGITVDGVAMIKPIEAALPITQDSLRRNLIVHCSQLRTSALAAYSHEKWLAGLQQDVRQEREDSPRMPQLKREVAEIERRQAENSKAFARSLTRFDAFRTSIRESIAQSEARLDQLRDAMQKHIDV